MEKECSERIPEKSPDQVTKNLQLDKKNQNLLRMLAVLNENYQYKFLFPRLDSYQNFKKVSETFPAMKKCNDVNPFEYANFDCVLIQANSFDDIHKSIKYGIWSSNLHINAFLRELFQKNQKKSKKVLLCFGMQQENFFTGLAEIVSDYSEEKPFEFWWDPAQPKGVFEVKWLFVKNLEYQSIDFEEVLEFMQNCKIFARKTANSIFRQFLSKPFEKEKSILHFFPIFDQREDQMNASRGSTDFKISLQKKERKKSEKQWNVKEKSGNKNSGKKFYQKKSNLNFDRKCEYVKKVEEESKYVKKNN